MRGRVVSASAVAVALAAVAAACGGSPPAAPTPAFVLPSVPPPPPFPPSSGVYRVSITGPAFLGMPFPPEMICTPPGVLSDLGFRSVDTDVVLEPAGAGWVGRSSPGATFELTVEDAGTVPSVDVPSLLVRMVRGTMKGRAVDPTSGWVVTAAPMGPPMTFEGQVRGLPAQPSTFSAIARGAAQFVDGRGGIHDCTAVSIRVTGPAAGAVP